MKQLTLVFYLHLART